MQFNDDIILSKYMIKTHFIMKVIAFHPETQTVDLVQDVYEYTNTIAGEFSVINELGMEVTAALQTLDIVYGVPVKQERWGKWHIQCCPAVGDTGYIEVMTNDIRDWVENGSLSIPWSDDHFKKNSCVFVPFVPNKTNCDPEYPATNESFVIKSDKINLTMTTPEEGKEKVTLTMTGITLTIDAEGKISLDAPDATVSATCNTVEAKASGSVTLDTPQTNITGKLNIDGEVTMGSKLDVTGDATLASNLTVEGTQITATDAVITCAGVVSTGVVSGADLTVPGTIPSMKAVIPGLQTHTHLVPGVQTGSGSTTTGGPNL